MRQSRCWWCVASPCNILTIALLALLSSPCCRCNLVHNCTCRLKVKCISSCPLRGSRRSLLAVARILFPTDAILGACGMCRPVVYEAMAEHERVFRGCIRSLPMAQNGFWSATSCHGGHEKAIDCSMAEAMRRCLGRPSRELVWTSRLASRSLHNQHRSARTASVLLHMLRQQTGLSSLLSSACYIQTPSQEHALEAWKSILSSFLTCMHIRVELTELDDGGL